MPFCELMSKAIWFIPSLLSLWAVAALYVDLCVPALRVPLTVIYGSGIITVKGSLRHVTLCLRPSNFPR